MLLSHKYKFFTIDIPRTGTRSLRETLNTIGFVDFIGAGKGSDISHHASIEEVKKFFLNKKLDLNEYFSMVTVRNPWKRYFSLFNYFKDYGEKYKTKNPSINWNHRGSKLNGRYSMKLFESDCENALEKIINYFPPQHIYYMIENKIEVSHVAQFENINKEFEFLCEQLSIKPIPKFLHLNKSPKNIKIKDVYNQKLIDLVEKKEYKTIKLKQYYF